MVLRRKLIAGNWKMNGLYADGMALAQELVGRITAAGPVGFDLLVCPPATLLYPVGQVLAGHPIALGGQDCHAAEKGAHTGDLSAPMLTDLGARYVIVGHSERRYDHGETDGDIAAKVAAAHAAGLVAVVCVGETLAQRESGAALTVVADQIAGSIPAGSTSHNLVVAYEPVWAIGTGRTAQVADVAEMHAHIRTVLAAKVPDPEKVQILYGGSVKPANAASLMAIADVDGALVGGASLVAGDFWAIAESCR
ncbi:MAG: triose-phosphate isomerase [Azospirillaceae bacterium]|nr:triose-phosphate isomerase [Azospirillaceae bacterium]